MEFFMCPELVKRYIGLGLKKLTFLESNYEI